MRKPNPLTKKQRAIIEFIAEFTKSKGYAPTFREIGSNFKITVKSAYDHCSAIKAKGALIWTSEISRSIRIVIG